MAVDFSSVI